jgi:8-oxo-dGTP pyrophosphatase MutT (NUDIX family)
MSKGHETARSEISAGGVVYRRTRGGAGLEILLGHQTDWNTGEATVRLPKGHVDPGETLEQAAAREVREETGRLARPRQRLDENHYAFTDRRTGERVDKRVVYFLMQDEGAAPDPPDDEMERIEWVALDAAVALLSFENERAIVQLAAEALQSPDPP